MSEYRSGLRSLGHHAARNLADTTKTVPQMQGITPRWLLRVLPWVQVTGGTYRVNRRLQYRHPNGRLSFISTGADSRVAPHSLREVPVFEGLHDAMLLDALADRFVQRQYAAGDVIAIAGQPADELMLIAFGKARKLGVAKYGDQVVVDPLGDGDFLGDETMSGTAGEWPHTVEAATGVTVLSLTRTAFDDLQQRFPPLRTHVQGFSPTPPRPVNRRGEAAIEMSDGHVGEPALPGTFVDYEVSPREYELSLTQTLLCVKTRVADLYNQPTDQVKEQLRLTIEAVREHQEYEILNNRDFGLLHNADTSQRIRTRNGPPAPDDLDNLISRRRKPQFLLAHPRAIAAFGRECNRLGVYPAPGEFGGRRVHAWRGIPFLPCDKIPISQGTSPILVMRTGEEHEGVVGLHLTGIPDEVEPSLSVRFMGIDEQAIISYLVSAYYSAAILVPDALGILENAEIGR